MSLSDTITNAVGAADPTGVLSAAGAAVGLIGSVLRAVPALKNATHGFRTHSNSNVDQTQPLHRTQTNIPAAEIGVDPERERRAYETVNYVLRELGNRICSAGLVDEHALTRALKSAAQHIDFNLFSGETNRLFASLAPKLEDPTLVNSVFTSIYFIGALTAELARSLPNYKESYVPLGPRIVQQLFRTAIGEDAFRENLTGNLDAYKTLATTAGLLRPTDIGYSAFPGFPAFSPSRYSSRSFNEVRFYKSVYERLSKHFDRFGFPQPTRSCQARVGMIREYRFISGDTPSRTVEVERADKSIGDSFGRVMHWLMCSADRLPTGQAVIAYYDQHVEFVRWIGPRMGYYVLSAAMDLDWSGDHNQLDPRARAIADTWIILMPSARARAQNKATKRASSAQLALYTRDGRPSASLAQSSQSRASISISPRPSQTQMNSNTPPLLSPASVSPVPSERSISSATSLPVRQKSNTKTVDERLNEVEKDFNNVLVPRCNKFLKTPPTDERARGVELRRLMQHIEKAVIGWLHGFPIPEDHHAQQRRKAMISHAQQILDTLDHAPKAVPVTNNTPAVELTGSFPIVTSSASQVSADLSPSDSSLSSLPPPYSQISPPPTSSSTYATNTAFSEKPSAKPIIRRKAPPPPKKLAKALYDFVPEAEHEDDLAFKEGDVLEIVERSAELDEDGWCKARVKGKGKIGLVPLEYIEIEKKPLVIAQAPMATHQPVQTFASAPQSIPRPLQSQYGAVVSPQNQALIQSEVAYSLNSPNTPQPSPQNSIQAAPEHGLGKKLEFASLGVAAVGAAAGVISVVQGQSQAAGETHPQPAGQASQQVQQSPNENLQSGGQTSREDQRIDAKNDIQDTTNRDAPIIPLADSLEDDSLPQIIDLSAFSFAPFEPQPLRSPMDQFVSPPTDDVYFTPQNSEIIAVPDADAGGTVAKEQPAVEPNTDIAESPLALVAISTTPAGNTATENDSVIAPEEPLNNAMPAAINHTMVGDYVSRGAMMGPVDYDDLGYES